MQHALALFLILVCPIWDAWYTRRLRRSTDPGMKIRAYLLAIAWLWTASIVAWWLVRPGFFFPLELSARPSRLSGAAARSGMAGLWLGLLSALFLPVALSWRSAKMRATLRHAMESFAFFLPATAAERALFAVVAITAGICEETLYRGYLIHYFTGHWQLALPAALVLSSCAFGVGHEYQGIRGILLTALLGGGLALLYIATGSLAWPMVVHALIDLRILFIPMKVMRSGTAGAGAEDQVGASSCSPWPDDGGRT